ncbi:DegV family protein [Solibacillus sp. CAU 1738]|uniref:DegV family protein n=1 Tax=Solibacillus sp. CAU 1738 TaxID=3140363 RepID=UPI0032610415
MAKKIAWVTDTAALLTKEFIQQHNVHVLPLNIVFEEGSLRETVDMTNDEFYEKLRAAKVHPKTSQPAFGEHVALYEKLKQEGYDCAIAVHTSVQLSGTYVSAFMASEQAGFKCYPIDSKIGSFPMMKMLEVGMQLANGGKEVEEIVQELENMTERSELAFIPASLAQLNKSGRVSGTAALLSQLLNIKLVISFDNGYCKMIDKVRSDKRAKKYVENLLDEARKKSDVSEVAVIHCNNEEGAKEWLQRLQQQYADIKFMVLPLSACVGVHAGEGTLGLSWVRN